MIASNQMLFAVLCIFSENVLVNKKRIKRKLNKSISLLFFYSFKARIP